MKAVMPGNFSFINLGCAINRDVFLLATLWYEIGVPSKVMFHVNIYLYIELEI